MTPKDYYLILGVPRTASSRRIRTAYRTLAKERHPDVVGSGGDRAFREINEAYDTLSDPERRRLHNHELQRAESLPPRGFAHRYDPPEPLVTAPLSILHHRETIHPSYEALFEHLLRNFVGPSKATKLEELNLEVVLSPDEALHGGSLPIGVPAFRACPACHGTGREWVFPCLSCGQRGLVEDQEVVEVVIPPRVRHGTVIDVPLKHLGIRNLVLVLHVSLEPGPG